MAYAAPSLMYRPFMMLSCTASAMMRSLGASISSVGRCAVAVAGCDAAEEEQHHTGAPYCLTAAGAARAPLVEALGHGFADVGLLEEFYQAVSIIIFHIVPP